jgi:Uncharacterized protein family UPF0016
MKLYIRDSSLINFFLLQQGNFFKDDKTTPEPSLRDVGFIHAFVASLSVIIVSELGDKTFFIAAIMAMRHPRITVFAGAIGALALMTVLSGAYWKIVPGYILIFSEDITISISYLKFYLRI